MRLRQHDIERFDEAYLRSLPQKRLQALSVKLLADLKEAHDRLNQTPFTSSRPPSTRAPCGREVAGSKEGGAVALPKSSHRRRPRRMKLRRRGASALASHGRGVVLRLVALAEPRVRQG